MYFQSQYAEADLGVLQHPLTIITKSSTLDVAAVLDPPLISFIFLFIHKSSTCFLEQAKGLGELFS